MTQLYEFLLLARISNLPTVWSNVIAALALAGSFNPATAAVLITAMSALYTGGMFLNDAFDKDYDAAARPNRPLPAGRVSAGHVWLGGFGLLACGVLLVSMHKPGAGIFAFALAGAILLYDAWHKNNPLAPIVMGLCRALVYLTTAAAVGVALGMKIAAAAVALGAYVAGLTYVAREENLDRLSSWWPIPLLLAAPLTAFALQPSLAMAAAIAVFLTVMTYAFRLLLRRQAGDVKSAVSLLIAAIALVDAVFVLSAGQPIAAGLCAAAFVLTLYFQRFVPGT